MADNKWRDLGVQESNNLKNLLTAIIEKAITDLKTQKPGSHYHETAKNFIEDDKFMSDICGLLDINHKRIIRKLKYKGLL